jgi:ribosomal protein S12 methylthiotransferase accessory factor
LLHVMELVDSRFGIVRTCTRLPKDRREPAVPVVYQATLSNFDLRRAPVLERAATGKGATAAVAARGAVVEALERYCASQWRLADMVVASSESLDAPFLEPGDFVLYSDRQYDRPSFPFRSPVPGEELTWVRGSLVGSGTPVYAPASLVYVNFAGVEGRELFTPPTSNGLAGGADLSSAVLSGIYELVERDAFLIAWLNRLPGPRIDFDETFGIAAGVRRHYRRFGMETLAFDLTTDLEIPVVMAVALDRSGGSPAATVGLGCNLDPAIALERAVMEVAQVRTGSVAQFRRQGPPTRLRRYEDVRGIADHAAFAWLPERIEEFDFLLGAGAVRSLADLPHRRRGGVEADLDYCRERLELAGCTCAFVDLTLPDLDRVAVRVVRAIATGLQPIHFGHGRARLGGRRLFDVPQTLGYKTQPSTEDDLNPCPHPLA